MKENQEIMASNASGSQKLTKNTLPKFEADIYTKIPPGDLIVFSVHYLIERKIKVTLEDIVSICFQLFPQKFGLKKFPKWPDSAFVSRRWSDVRRKGYIAANAEFEYNLTSKGLSVLKKVEKALGITAPKPVIKVQSAQPKKEVVASPVKKIQLSTIKEKATEPVKKIRKIKPLTSKAPAALQKKIAQLFEEKEKVTLPAPVQKTRPIRTRKVQPVQKEKVIQPVLVKKIRPVRAKQATPPAPIKKVRPVSVKKPSSVFAPIKQVQKTAQPVTAQVMKARTIQAEKAAFPAPVKKTLHTKKISPAPAKQVIVPEAKVQTTQKVALAVPVKKTRPMRAKKVFSAPVKQAQTPEIKVLSITQAKKKQVIPASKPVGKPQPIRAAKAKTKIVRPKQVRKTKPLEPVMVQQGKIGKSQLQKADFITSINVSREEKERAGKFARMMERSDAYINYKKYGTNSKINEFDFRSLLLCTMESSPETLARNIKLFKGYAGIHNRQDLTAFLVFCEDKFSYLLKPQNKAIRKVKK